MPTVTLANGLRLSYAEHGDRSGAAVVLLPAPTDSWRSYEPVLGRLPASLWTIAVSQRGHGDSDKPARDYGVEDFADDVVALLDALAIGRALLVAHSGACLTARRVAIDHPDRVAGLVLEAAPATLLGDPALSAFAHSVVAAVEDPIDPDFARSFVVDTSAPGVAPDLLDVLTVELCKVPARVWREVFADLLMYDDRAELGRIAAPSLLVWGDADELIGREQQDQLVRGLPAAELLTYAGAGHTPRWEAPERFAADVAAFAERIAYAG